MSVDYGNMIRRTQFERKDKYQSPHLATHSIGLYSWIFDTDMKVNPLSNENKDKIVSAKETWQRLDLLVNSIGTCLAQCPDAFERHADVCYKVVAIKANWIDSREYCKLFGCELLRIETANEQIFIDGILTRVHGSINDEPYWINGGDMLSENEFRWFFESHSEFIPHNGYTNFSQGQPDNAGSVEHCLEIIFNGHNALWNDRNCDAVRNFICEAKLAGQTEIVG